MLTKDEAFWQSVPVVIAGMNRSLRFFPGIASQLFQSLEDAGGRIELLIRRSGGAVHHAMR